MSIEVTHAKTDQTSYRKGDRLKLALQLKAAPNRLPQVENLSVDLFRVENRDQFAFGFGGPPTFDGDSLAIESLLPADFASGLYVVGSVTVSSGQIAERVTFESVFFYVYGENEQPIEEETLRVKVAEVLDQRREYAQKVITTSARAATPNPKAYRVLIAGVGCLLHAPQQLEGFIVYPLGRGFSYGYMREVANLALWKSGLRQLDPNAGLDQRHQAETPTFLIDYFRVVGVDHNDVLEHCRQHANVMFDLLGLDRGQKPREFFCMAVDVSTGQAWHLFAMPWYKGNLISDFNPVSTANLLEQVIPKLQSNPFLHLLLRSYAEATAEEDSGISHLRAWTVLELLADRAIAKGQPIYHLDGTPILNHRGNPKTSDAKEARVYEYVRQSGVGFPSQMGSNHNGQQLNFLLGADQSHPGYAVGTRLIPLWDVVRAAYAIRNRVAHEGFFSEDKIDPTNGAEVLAADLMRNTPLDPRQWVKHQVQLYVRIELHKP